MTRTSTTDLKEIDAAVQRVIEQNPRTPRVYVEHYRRGRVRRRPQRRQGVWLVRWWQNPAQIVRATTNCRGFVTFHVDFDCPGLAPGSRVRL